MTVLSKVPCYVYKYSRNKDYIKADFSGNTKNEIPSFTALNWAYLQKGSIQLDINLLMHMHIAYRCPANSKLSEQATLYKQRTNPSLTCTDVS